MPAGKFALICVAAFCNERPKAMISPPLDIETPRAITDLP